MASLPELGPGGSWSTCGSSSKPWVGLEDPRFHKGASGGADGENRLVFIICQCSTSPRPNGENWWGFHHLAVPKISPKTAKILSFEGTPALQLARLKVPSGERFLIAFSKSMRHTGQRARPARGHTTARKKPGSLHGSSKRCLNGGSISWPLNLEMSRDAKVSAPQGFSLSAAKKDHGHWLIIAWYSRMIELLHPVRGINGCNLEPPQDVAHVQFRARIECRGRVLRQKFRVFRPPTAH